MPDRVKDSFRDRIIDMSIEGKSSTEIAMSLNISYATVRSTLRAFRLAMQGDAKALQRMRASHGENLVSWALQRSENKQKTSIEYAIAFLCKMYAQAKADPVINDPLAYALYHTWKSVNKYY